MGARMYVISHHSAFPGYGQITRQRHHIGRISSNGTGAIQPSVE